MMKRTIFIVTFIISLTVSAQSDKSNNSPVPTLSLVSIKADNINIEKPAIENIENSIPKVRRELKFTSKIPTVKKNPFNSSQKAPELKLHSSYKSVKSKEKRTDQNKKI